MKTQRTGFSSTVVEYVQSGNTIPRTTARSRARADICSCLICILRAPARGRYPVVLHAQEGLRRQISSPSLEGAHPHVRYRHLKISRLISKMNGFVLEGKGLVPETHRSISETHRFLSETHQFISETHWLLSETNRSISATNWLSSEVNFRVSRR